MSWKEEFKERFIRGAQTSPGDVNNPPEWDEWLEAGPIEMIDFISDIRKKDEEELIKMLNGQAFPNIELILQLIKDYYNTN